MISTYFAKSLVAQWHSLFAFIRVTRVCVPLPVVVTIKLLKKKGTFKPSHMDMVHIYLREVFSFFFEGNLREVRRGKIKIKTIMNARFKTNSEN